MAFSISATHSGQGGTGDVGILTAANRMVLMLFAQVATRIGGAITVTLVLIALSRMAYRMLVNARARFLVPKLSNR